MPAGAVRVHQRVRLLQAGARPRGRVPAADAVQPRRRVLREPRGERRMQVCEGVSGGGGQRLADLAAVGAVSARTG